nr:hypothetical protein [Tanacetum cinerariifolium]
MVAPIIFVFVDSLEEIFRDRIDIGVDVTHHVPVTLHVFPVSTILMRLDQHKEAIGDDGAVEMVFHNRMRDERWTRIKIERQLALVQEERTQSRISHAQDREIFKKLEDLMTS